MKKIVVNPRWCVGCGRCEVACITAHSKSRDIVKAYKKEALRGTNRVTLYEGEDPFVMQCRQCAQKPCVKACISGSMHVDVLTGIIANDESRCVGCMSCVAACPNGAVRALRRDGRKLAHKCDLCMELDNEPACVSACPNGALQVKEVQA